MEEKKIIYIQNTYWVYFLANFYFEEMSKFINVDDHIKNNNYTMLVQHEKVEEYEKMYNVCKKVVRELKRYFDYKIGLATLINYNIGELERNNIEKLIELRKVNLFYKEIKKLEKEERINEIDYYIFESEVKFLEENFKNYNKIEEIKLNMIEIEKNIKIEIKNLKEEMEKEENKYLNIMTIFLTIFSILGITSTTFLSSNKIGVKELFIVLGAEILGITTISILIKDYRGWNIIKVMIMLIISSLFIFLGRCIL